MKRLNRIFARLVAFILICSSITPVILATQITDDPVSAVIKQLEAIDTLQEIQFQTHSSL